MNISDATVRAGGKDPFEYQAPTPEHIEAMKYTREALRQAATAVIAHVPACAERTLALRKIEEASMWANKAIVFDGERYIP